MSNEPFADYGEQDEDGDIITDDYLVRIIHPSHLN